MTPDYCTTHGQDVPCASCADLDRRSDLLDAAVEMLRELQYAAGDDYPYNHCAFCAANVGEPHRIDRDGGKCKLAALLARIDAEAGT